MWHQCFLSTTTLTPVLVLPLQIFQRNNNASWMKNNRLFNHHVRGSYCTSTIQQPAKNSESSFQMMNDDGIDENKNTMFVGFGAHTKSVHHDREEEGGLEQVTLLAEMPSNNDQPVTTKQQDKNNVHPIFEFEGSRTKFGKRKKNDIDRRNNNARVRNSYLKLLLEDAVLDQLYHITCQMKHEWEEEVEGRQRKMDNALIKDNDGQVVVVVQPTIIRSKKQTKRQLVTIQPRSRSSLHMTFFFLGKVLDRMTSTDVQRWQIMVKECCVAMDNSSEGDDNNHHHHHQDYSLLLKFKALTMFPPGKSNLLVATFDPSIALDTLYEKLWHLALSEKSPKTTSTSDCYDDDTAVLEMKEEYEFPLLRDLMLQQQKKRKQCGSAPSWVAHVTLASIVGGSKEERNSFGEWVNGMAGTSRDSVTIAEKELAALQSHSIHALGVALGGPIPDVREHIIDWNFPFSGTMATTTETIESAELW